MKGPVVGIDLGTTNTVIGVVQDGQAMAIADVDDEKLIPSVVSFHPGGNVLVGRSAKERRLVDAANTIYSVKRLIGRAWDSEEVKTARSRFPFEMREGPGQAALVVARGETYTLPEISAFVLRKAKAVAEEALGAPVEKAVITVPANFNDLQRAATKVAGRVAGLEVLRILNEPTAAALAYGFGKGSTERIAIYDFGGGTFDVTLLDLSGNVFEVLATAGNTFLGGDDVDLSIAERMAEAFLAQHRYDPHEDPQAFERLRAAAENVKIRLSTEESIVEDVTEVAHGPGGKALGLKFSMTRADLDALAGSLVEKTFEVCKEALGIARLGPGEFDQILLVGGSTRMPLVRARVEEFFGRPVLEHISPDEVVAIGAAIQANALTGTERRRADIPQAPLPAARQSSTLTRGQTSPSGFQHKSQPPPLPKKRTGPPRRKGTMTSPGVYPGSSVPSSPRLEGKKRVGTSTSPGLQPAVAPPGKRKGSQPPMVIQPPQGMPQTPIPTTADGPTKRPITEVPGKGPPPLPPRTVGGLGPRGRVPTGEGLGPAAAQARARMPSSSGLGRTLVADADDPTRQSRTPTGSGLGPAAHDAKRRARIPTGSGLGPVPQPDATLASAEAEAKAAMEQAESGGRISALDHGWGADSEPAPPPPTAPADDDFPLPLVESDAAPRTAEMAPSAEDLAKTAAAAHAQQDEADMRAKYGDLPLIMPGAGGKKAELGKTTQAADHLRETFKSDGADGPTMPGPVPPLESKPTLESSQMPDIPGLDLGGADAAAAPPQPPLRQAATQLLGQLPGEDDQTAQNQTADALKQLAAPNSTEEVTRVKMGSAPLSPPTPPLQPPQPPLPPLQTQPLPAQPQATTQDLPPLEQPMAPADDGLQMPGVPDSRPPGTPGRIGAQDPPPAAAVGAGLLGATAALGAGPQLPPLGGQSGAPEPVIHEMPGHPHPALGQHFGAGAGPQAPLLVDVTPLSLSVETVSGYCDTIINRNTPVPCEETRQFVTARDNQPMVRIRISQGESGRFEDNTVLGEVELTGLRPAPRGQVAIAVTFSLDTDGMLNVSARDIGTGNATSARIRLVGLPDQEADVAQMAARHAAHPPM